MYPVSSDVIALLNENTPQKLRITGVDGGGNTITITDANVMMGGFSIDRFCCSGSKLELGTTSSAELTLKLDNSAGTFDGVSFEGVELYVEIGVGTTWIPCGYFAIDEQTTKLNTISLSGLDRMMKAEYTPPVLVPWTDNNGNYITDNHSNILYLNTGLSFPATVKQVVDQVCEICGLTLGTDISGFPNANYTIASTPAVAATTTFRDYLKWAAALMGKCAYIDWRGLLCFGWYSSASYTSTASTRFSSDMYDSDITITGVTYSDDEDNVYVAGTEDYAIDISGNKLLGSNVQSALNTLYNSIRNFTYRPIRASVMPAPYLWPLDMVVYTDKDGVNHNAALTNVNLTINASTEIQSKGETEQRNAYARTSGMTLAQMIAYQRLQKAAQDAVSNLDLSLTQQEIFDRLTDGGLEQGLALESTTNPGPSAAGDKKIFLNLDYARFGKLVADFIQGGTLKLGGLDNVNGELQILDANGNVIGTWNNAGISVNSGQVVFSSSDATGDGTLTISEVADMAFNYRWNDIDSEYSYYLRLYADTLVMENETLNSALLLTNDRVYIHRTSASETRHPRVAMLDEVTGKDVELSTDYGLLLQNYSNGNYTIVGRFSHSGISTTGSLTVSGTKSRVVETEQYADRLLYCYETPTPMFGDVGEGEIGEDGLCYIWLDPVFAQTIATSQYQVFLQPYGSGTCWVDRREGICFVVRGEPDMKFGWEIKAKQKGYDQRRLERDETPFEVPEQTYGADAAQYIEDLKKGRVTA